MKQFAFVILTVVISSYAKAQSDFGMWNNVAVELPINNKFSTGMDFQVRFDNYLRSTDELFFSPYVKYDLHKHIRLDFAYRLTRFPSNSSMGHREMLDVIFKDLQEIVKKDSRLSFDVRLRTTFEYNTRDENSTNFRLKAEAEYNLPKTKLKPELAAEMFYHLNDQLIYTAESVRAVNRFNKYRFRAGITYPLNKRNDIKLFYLYQSQISSDNTDHVIGLKYTYQFKKLIK